MMPRGIFSTPKTTTVSYCPARDGGAPPSIRAAAPLAHPASTSTMGMPVMPRAPSTLCPVATPP